MDIIQSLINSGTAIVITGPTASGKTAIALKLSKYLPVEIISADSRQIFRYLDIGTAKPTPEELQSVKHNFIDYLSPDETFSAGMFAREATKVVNSLFIHNKIPLIVGGTGLYIKALCDGFLNDGTDSFPREEQQSVRNDLEHKLQSAGIDSLYADLMKYDPQSAILYNDKNPRRILRALEYFIINKMPFSEAQRQLTQAPGFSNITFYITEERSSLYERINERTRIMWNAGLPEETWRILEMGFSPSLNSLNTVGYKETISFLNGEITAPVAIDLIAQHTRNYAKRQITWFKKRDSLIPIYKYTSPSQILDLISKQLQTNSTL